MDESNLKQTADILKNFTIDEKINLMEVCGTHTNEYFRTGVKDIFPPNLNLIDGPGCPVCVTPNEYLDRALEIGRQHSTIITTFGDMMRVPSSYSSLLKEKAELADIRIVYSPMDALAIARENPQKEVIFLSVGFETTIPTEAAVVLQARNQKINNFSILAGNKLTPPAVKILLDSGEVKIDGFILPGHVSVITGIKAWRYIAEDYGKPCVIAGFESKDLVIGTLMLVQLIKDGKKYIQNEYTRAVTEQGNLKAQEIMMKIFEPCDSNWRGIGVIPQSGMKLTADYFEFDAEKKFPVTLPPVREPKGCRCGEVLRGVISPTECPLFATQCTPQTPVGACMVSSEGSCAAFYKYKG